MQARFTQGLFAHKTREQTRRASRARVCSLCLMITPQKVKREKSVFFTGTAEMTGALYSGGWAFEAGWRFCRFCARRRSPHRAI